MRKGEGGGEGRRGREEGKGGGGGGREEGWEVIEVTHHSTLPPLHPPTCAMTVLLKHE